MKDKFVDRILNFFIIPKMKRFDLRDFKKTHKSLYNSISAMLQSSQKSIVWIAISEDDFIAYSGNYILRAEQMDDWWWWALYKDNEEIDAVHYHDTLPPQSEEEALRVCYESYLKDKIKNIQDEKHIIIR